MDVTTVGLDIGKSVFHLIGLDVRGKIIRRQRLTRARLFLMTANLPPCLIGMEACPGSHFLARRLTEQGHNVRLLPAQYVRPYVKSNKNDFLDAEAIAEAVGRPTMRFVPIKDIGSTRPAGAASDAFAPGGAPDRFDQSGPILSLRARHCDADRPPKPRTTSAWCTRRRRIRPIGTTALATADAPGRMASSRRADRRSNRHDRAHRSGAPRVSAPALCTRSWGAHCHRRGRCHRRWSDVFSRAPVRCMARPGPAPTFNGRQSAAAQHQHAREPLLADAVRSRCPVGCAERGTRTANGIASGRG